jgi:hypothetical protein
MVWKIELINGIEQRMQCNVENKIDLKCLCKLIVCIICKYVDFTKIIVFTSV